jgi:hypothetical protein
MEGKMARMRLEIAVIMLVALLAFPRAGNAGLIDFIMEMSGPTMFSLLLLDCEYNLESRERECHIYDKRVVGDSRAREGGRLWFVAGGGFYTSTESKNGTYDWFENHMVMFEPTLQWRSSERTHHGIGLTYDVLFGRHFKTFANVGVKVTPITLRVANVDVTPTIRFYPEGFAAEDFNRETRDPNKGRGGEVVIGATLQFRK